MAIVSILTIQIAFGILAVIIQRRESKKDPFLLFAEQFADDDVVLHLTGTFVDLVNLGVAH